MSTLDGRTLAKKPLVEAIFELRWELKPTGAPIQGQPAGAIGLVADPHYKLALGRFSARAENRLPHYEPLPAASVPDEMVAYVVQHRFRRAKDKWPLAQLGPGVLTFNVTDAYDWPLFRTGARDVVADWRSSYPKDGVPRLTRVLLKYIDAVHFDYDAGSVFPFLEKLKVRNALATDFLSPSGVTPNPESLVWRSEFKSTSPLGRLSIQIATARKDDSPAVVWETTLVSAEADVPQTEQALDQWLEEAHKTTSSIFFAMVEGELHDAFA